MHPTIMDQVRPRQRNFLCLCLLGGVLLLADADSCQAEDAPSLAQRFLGESASSWEEYERFADSLQGTMRVQLFRDGKLVADVASTIKQKPGFKCAEIEWSFDDLSRNRDRTGRGFVQAFNPRYAFELQRKSATQPWLITAAAMANEQEEYKVFADQAAVATMGCRALVTLDLAHSLHELVRRPSFRVLHVKPVVHNECQAVQVVFDNSHPFPPTKGERFCPFQKGVLTLDPSRFWCVRAYDVDCLYDGGASALHGEMNYRDCARSKYPIPVRVVQRRVSQEASGRTTTFVSEQTFDLKESALPSDQEFSLSAFGFPEPPGIEWEKPVPWWLWLAVGGAGLLITGAAFSWLRRRALRRHAVE